VPADAALSAVPDTRHAELPANPALPALPVTWNTGMPEPRDRLSFTRDAAVSAFSGAALPVGGGRTRMSQRRRCLSQRCRSVFYAAIPYMPYARFV
jgi:hypothetical protein